MYLDLHTHTTAYSPCSVMSPDELMIAACEAGLDGICITEHHTMWPLEDARALSRKHDISVFRGVEITTTGGDILVFGLDEAPDGIVTPSELRYMVDLAGGVAIAAHPFRGFLVFGFGLLKMDVEDAIENPFFSYVHGLEVCNGMVTSEENEFAGQVADALGVLKVGGSDAHGPGAVGTCVTRFDNFIKDEKELVSAILGGRYTLERRK
ncbi:MAG: PHP domain-containing protein [Deltaproteobacteria bacterium]|nr:PHP domain-containing protein [Deltaproteobacteria bacterium]